jgi:hypothetical protein
MTEQQGRDCKAKHCERAMPIAPEALRQINDAILDVQSSDYNNFDKSIKKLARLLHSPELDELSRRLAELGLDLDPWIEAGAATGRHMPGTGRLDWPAELEKELGTVIRLIDRFAERGMQDALSFAHTFRLVHRHRSFSITT